MDLFRHLADQLVDIQSREHRVGDRHRDAKVVALVAQQIVIDVIADPVLNLFGDDGDDLREGMQPLELFLAPRPVVTAEEFAAAEDPPVRRQRQQRIVSERTIQSAADKLRQCRQRFHDRNAGHPAGRVSDAPDRGRDGFILVAYRMAGLIAGVLAAR